MEVDQAIIPHGVEKGPWALAPPYPHELRGWHSNIECLSGNTRDCYSVNWSQYRSSMPLYDPFVTRG